METEQERPLEQPVTDDKPTDETPSSDGPSMEDTIRDEYRRLTSSENADTGDDTTAAAPAAVATVAGLAGSADAVTVCGMAGSAGASTGLRNSACSRARRETSPGRVCPCALQ